MTHDVIAISNKQPDAWYYLYRQYFQSLLPHTPKVFQPQHWGGLMTKPRVLYQLIKDRTITTSHIIFTDCWDLLFCATPDEIMRHYAEFNADVVVSSERNCFPGDLKEDFDSQNPPTEYKYLNSGCIVGKTEAILSCLEAMDLPSIPDDHYDEEKKCNIHPNDQFEWMKIYFKQPVSIKLDYLQQLSMTLHNAKIEELDFSEKRIRNKVTGSYPCTLHFNGGSKDDLAIRNPILQHMNLND